MDLDRANEDGLTDNKVTELCTVTPGVCYEVTASFSGKVDDGKYDRHGHGHPARAASLYCLLPSGALRMAHREDAQSTTSATAKQTSARSRLSTEDVDEVRVPRLSM